jgi:PAS domain-containing protein
VVTDDSQHWLLEAWEHGVLLLNRECQVEYINPAAERLLGVRRDDVTGGLLRRDLLQKGEHRLSDVATLVLRAALGASAVGAGTT